MSEKELKWECFCDEAYYGTWAVRNIDDKSFNSAIHVNTKEEAEFLVNELNSKDKLQSRIEELEGALFDIYTYAICAGDKDMIKENVVKIKEIAKQATKEG